MQPEGLHITQEQARSLLSGAANHEIRLLGLLVMEPGHSYSPTELRNLVLDASGSRSNRITGHQSMRSYLEESLKQEGLVELSGNRAALTFEGETLGKAMAGHMLRLSLHSSKDVSLRRVWGMRHSRFSVERPQYPRYEIYRHLLACSKTSVTQLHDVVGAGADYSTTYHRIRTLEVDDMIDTELLLPRGIEYGVLSVHALAQARSRNRTGISKDIDAVIREVAGVSPDSHFWVRDVFDHAISQLGYPDTPQTYANIKARLQRLRRATVLVETNVDNQRDRTLWLRPEKRQVVQSAVEVVDSLHNDTEHFIKVGREKAKAILNNPDAVTTLIGKCLANSPEASNAYAQRGSQSS